jgi:exosortase A
MANHLIVRSVSRPSAFRTISGTDFERIVSTPPGRSWRKAGVILGACLIVLAVVHRHTASSMLQTWSQDPFRHGYFVVAVAVYLAWIRRGALKALYPQGTVTVLPLIGVLSMLWLLGNLTGTVAVQHSCVLAILLAVTWVVVGTAATRAMAFPLGLLLFALPIGDRLAPILQELTANCATGLLVLTGVPAALQGYALVIGETTWRVSEACGGVNYVIASVAMAYVYAGIVYRSWCHRAALVFAAAAVSLVGNCIRVYSTILLDYIGATRVAAGMGHELYGLLVFAIMISVLFITCGRWHEARPASNLPRFGTPAGASVSATSPRRIVMCAIAGMLLVASGPLAATVLSTDSGIDGWTQQTAPVESGPWKAVDDRLSMWSPRFATPHSEFLQTYQSGGDVVKLYVAFYGTIQPRVNMTSRSNVLYESPWWPAAERRRTIVLGTGSLEVMETMLRFRQSSLLVWNWYEIDGSVTGDRHMAKFLLAKAILFGSRRACRAIALATQPKAGVKADDVLRQFIGGVVLPDGRSWGSS